MEPTETKLADQFSVPNAPTVEWDTALRAITDAQIWCVHTTRVDGRPHVTPLLTVVDGDAIYFCTGPDEQKGHNLAANPCVALTTGGDDYAHGCDYVVDGKAVRVTDDARLRELAERWVDKYTDEWRFGVGDGAFTSSSHPGAVWVFEVRPAKVYAYDRETGSATRFLFVE
jgi:nitroimidazol reductase NimA-like FMN-containing flavoprotein (pyridoxamine 5'-phosphate oxidase superfamily)